MFVRGGFVDAVAIALILLGSHGCSDPERIDLKVLTTRGPDPLATADRLRLAVSDPAGEQSLSIQDREHFELELELELESRAGMISLEGYAGSTMVARGETPPLILSPDSQQLNLLVAPSGVLSSLESRIEHPAVGTMAVLIPAMGVLLAGGRDADGDVVGDTYLYDFFEHTLAPLSAVPGGRNGGVTATCGSYCGLVALGEGLDGLATSIQRYEAGAWTAYSDQLPAAERRRGAASVLMEDGNTMILGGEGASGALDSILSLNPGTLYMEPLIKVMDLHLREARVDAAAALGTGAVILVGGQTAGGRSAEILYIAAGSAQDLAMEGPKVASGAAALSLADGRVAVIGGRAADGTLLRDAWIIDTISLEVTHLPQALAVGRADHRALRVADRLVVLGGVTDDGLAADAEVLAADSLAAVARAPMAAPRQGFAVERLGVGSFLVAGGEGAAGPEPVLEVYETDQSLW